MENAFDVVVEHYGNLMLKLAVAQLHDMHLAQDAVQDAFLKLYKNQKRFLGQPFEKSYIATTVINACRDITRTSWARRILLFRETPEPTVSGKLPDETPVLDAISKLPPKHSEVLLLHYFVGLDQRELASALGISNGSLRTRLTRARSILKEILIKEGLNYEA